MRAARACLLPLAWSRPLRQPNRHRPTFGSPTRRSPTPPRPKRRPPPSASHRSRPVTPRSGRPRLLRPRDSLMPHHTPLISTIVVCLVLAFILGAVMHRVRASPLIGYLLAGVLIGPFTPGY